MQVITAPDIIVGSPTVFLAGGITNCPDWQAIVIRMLADYQPGVLLNPRRHSFPIGDPSKAREQIAWEFHALNSATIFSMWFPASESVQPICMYELGRHLERLKDQPARIIIGVEPGYAREEDVLIQTALVASDIAAHINHDLVSHAMAIHNAVKRLHNCGQ